MVHYVIDSLFLPELRFDLAITHDSWQTVHFSKLPTSNDVIERVYLKAKPFTSLLTTLLTLCASTVKPT